MSLRVKSILIIGLMAALLGSYVAFWWQTDVIGKGTMAAQRDAEKLVDAAAESLVDPLLKNQFGAVIGSLDRFSEKYPDWIYISFVNKDGMQIYPLNTIASAPLAQSNDESYRATATPQFLGESLGVLNVAVDLHPRLQQLVEDTRDLVRFILLSMVFIMAGLVMLMDRVVVRPLKQLGDAMEDVSKQRFNTPLPESSGEIGDLVQGFSAMRQQLQAHELQLTAALEQAERANVAKSRFLSSMSHELRTPLNAIMGYAQLMSMDDALDSENREGVAEILAASDHLLQMISQILDLSAIEAGNLKLQVAPIDLERLLAECEKTVLPLQDKHGVAINKDTSKLLQGTLDGDALRLKQVMLNLLSNALKYSGAGTQAVLYAESHGDWIKIGVRDNGAGINRALQGDLFKPFERLGAEKTVVEGAGIGLSLTRDLARIMGGELNFTSSEGNGSDFWVELPAKAQA